MRMENQPFQDVSPTKNGDVPARHVRVYLYICIYISIYLYISILGDCVTFLGPRVTNIQNLSFHVWYVW